MRDATVLQSAIDVASRGLVVIPVPRPRPGAAPGAPGDGKVPAMAWRAYQTRRPTEDELRAWFATPMNIAVITGELSGVVVIDADSPEAVAWIRRRLPWTPWQTRTAKGYHLWYRHPSVRVSNRARIETGDGRLALDVRGDGGYVIAPGSVHATGTIYEFAGDWTITRDRLPRFWPGWLQRPTRPAPPARTGPKPTGAVIDRARRYLAAIPQPEIGHGSDTATLYAACKTVRGFGISESEATELLCEWAGGRPGWTREWIAQKVRNALAYGTEPMGSLR